MQKHIITEVFDEDLKKMTLPLHVPKYKQNCNKSKQIPEFNRYISSCVNASETGSELFIFCIFIVVGKTVPNSRFCKVF